MTLTSAVCGLSLVASSATRSFWISAALLVPDHLRGRVLAVFAMMFMGMAPIGALVAGALAQRIGPASTIRLGGQCCIAAALAFHPALQREIAETEAAGT
jgi:hypothetical protein